MKKALIVVWGITTIRTLFELYNYKERKKVRKDFGDYYINTRGNYIYVMERNFSFYSIDSKIFVFY
ncbi:MAG: hypothetical protein Q3980_11250 [Turicibacter sp.]|nr:hypothetical protein [Turicibacter sp.]